MSRRHTHAALNIHLGSLAMICVGCLPMQLTVHPSDWQLSACLCSPKRMLRTGGVAGFGADTAHMHGTGSRRGSLH